MIPGMAYHLISRVVAKQFLITTERQRRKYLELQWRALQHVDWRLLGYALMSNHIHLVAVAGEAPLDAWIRPVHTQFADLINRDEKRIGPVLARGPAAYHVDGGRVAHLLAYVHNNPVRANLVSSAVESTWTSHRAYVGAGEVPPCLDVNAGRELVAMNADDFDAWVGDPAQRHERSFSEDAHEREVAQLMARERSPILRSEHEQVAVEIVDRAAALVGTTPAQIRSGTRKSQELNARVVAVWCATRLGLSERVIGQALHLSQQRVSSIRGQPPAVDMDALTQIVVNEVRRARTVESRDADNG
jgi:REP element-mobilizing transposase RayT